MQAQTLLTILLQTALAVLVHYINFLVCNFIFELQEQSKLLVYTYLVDTDLHSVIVRNNLDIPIQVYKNTNLGTIQDLDFEHCFYTMSNIADLALHRPKLICSTVSNSLTEKETILPNSVTVYRDMYTVKNISDIVNNYL